MTARYRNGWIEVPYNGHDLSTVEISTSPGEPAWRGAYLDWDSDGSRVAKVRPPEDPGTLQVLLRVNGRTTPQGTLRLS